MIISRRFKYPLPVMGGALNIVIGLVCIGGGLSGRLVIVGTDNGPLLAGLGVILVGVGTYRLVRARKKE